MYKHTCYIHAKMRGWDVDYQIQELTSERFVSEWMLPWMGKWLKK